MRANFSTALEQRLRRPDSDVRLMVEAAVVENEDAKNSKDDWEGADSTTGFDIFQDGVRLDGTNTILIESTLATNLHTDLSGSTPWVAAQVVWSGTNPAEMEIHRIRATLDPQQDSGEATDVGYWVCDIFAVESISNVETEGTRIMPLVSPLRVEVTNTTAPTEYTFDYATLPDRPRPKSVRPIDPSGSITDPTSWIRIRAVTSNGTPATNVGWAYTTAVNVTNGGNVMSGISVEDGIISDYVASDNGQLPTIGIETGTYATTTLMFTTTSPNNRLDLTVAPATSSLVEFVGEGVARSGSALTYHVRATSGDSWTTYGDGQTGEDIAVAANDTYEVECILTPDAGGTVTPILRNLAAREVVTKDLSDVAEVVGGGFAVDPVELKGEIPECQIRAIRDGHRDFNDAITELLSIYDIGDIQFRIWVGSDNLQKKGSSTQVAQWMKLDDYLIDDYQCESGAIILNCLSPLALCKAQLPKYDTAANQFDTLIYSVASSWTLKDTYEDLRDNQLEVQGRWVGASIEDDTTEVAKQINERSEGKDELDAIAFLAGGCITSIQGRLSFVDMHEDKAVVAVFPSEEILPTLVSPGFANRIPEAVVEYKWNEDERRFENIIYRVHGPALANLGIARLSAPRRIPDVAAKWISGTNADVLASNVGKRWVNKFGTGMTLLGFQSVYAHPELTIGDLVGVETDSFVAVDPNTSNAVKGRKWIIGCIVETDIMGKAFTVWVREYADIISTSTDGTMTVGFRRNRAQVTKSGDQVYTTALVTVVAFDVENYDVGGLHDNSSNNARLTIPPNGEGTYKIDANLPYQGLVNDPRVALQLNGTTISYIALAAAATSGNIVISDQRELEVGDYINLYVSVGPLGAHQITIDEDSIFSICRLGL